MNSRPDIDVDAMMQQIGDGRARGRDRTGFRRCRAQARGADGRGRGDPPKPRCDHRRECPRRGLRHRKRAVVGHDRPAVLTDDRIEGIVSAVQSIADHARPGGPAVAEWDRPTGLHIQRVRTPLGVIGVIYESRPNVTADAGALCLKAGNAAILRGGSESFHSLGRSMPAWSRGCAPPGCPTTRSSWCPPATARRWARCWRMTASIDVIVPRGGQGLVGWCKRDARVPVSRIWRASATSIIDNAADLEKSRRYCRERQDAAHRHLRRR